MRKFVVSFLQSGLAMASVGVPHVLLDHHATDAPHLLPHEVDPQPLSLTPQIAEMPIAPDAPLAPLAM